MRARVGLAIGFAAGYYLGAKAGRERYVEMRRWISRARDSEFVDTATEKARAVVDLGVERARVLIDNAGNGRDDTLDLDAEAAAAADAANRATPGSTGYSPSR